MVQGNAGPVGQHFVQVLSLLLRRVHRLLVRVQGPQAVPCPTLPVLVNGQAQGSLREENPSPKGEPVLPVRLLGGVAGADNDNVVALEVPAQVDIRTDETGFGLG